MIGISCERVRDLAAEAALGVLDTEERDAVLTHLETCPACRELVDSHVRVGDSLLSALPETDVPADVAAAIRRDAPSAPPAPAAPNTMPEAPRAHRFAVGRVLLLAAAVVLVVAGAAALAIDRSGDDQTAAAAPGVIVAPSGEAAGAVRFTSGASPWIYMDIDGQIADGSYRCVVVLADGSTVDVGAIDVAGGAGSWDGPIDVDPSTITGVKVVATDGTVVATADVAAS